MLQGELRRWPSLACWAGTPVGLAVAAERLGSFGTSWASEHHRQRKAVLLRSLQYGSHQPRVATEPLRCGHSALICAVSKHVQVLKA